MSQDFDFTDPSGPIGEPAPPTPPPAPPATPTPPPPPPRKPTPVAPAVDPLYRSPVSVGAGLLVIAALLGGLGYLGYDSYKNPPPAPPAAETPAAPTPAPAPGGMAGEAPASAPANQTSEVAGEVASLKSTLQTTVEQVAALTARPAPDLKPIEDRISEMGKATEPLAAKLTAVEEKVAAMGKAEPADAGRIEALEKKLGDVTGQLDALKASIAEMGKTAMKPATPPVAESAQPVADVNQADAAMSQAVDLFEQKKYAESLERFTKLQADHPDDARVWYYSALANGLASRNWRGETERLVMQGVEKEKAGTPEKSKIDALFASLTAANGKDWLAAYRARAAAR